MRSELAGQYNTLCLARVAFLFLFFDILRNSLAHLGPRNGRLLRFAPARVRWRKSVL